jgi:hypothetical protein
MTSVDVDLRSGHRSEFIIHKIEYLLWCLWCRNRTWIWGFGFVLDNTLSWIFIVLAHWNNNPWLDMWPHSDTLSWLQANQSLLFLLNAAFLAEKQQIPKNIIPNPQIHVRFLHHRHLYLRSMSFFSNSQIGVQFSNLCSFSNSQIGDHKRKFT